MVHPGPPGDAGVSRDYAILENEERWGVTVFQVTSGLMTGWASGILLSRHDQPAYRQLVAAAAVDAVLEPWLP